MAITVHQFDYSPYCIPITAVLKAFGVSFRTVEVRVRRRDRIIKLTGGHYYQVPVLQNGSDIVYESGPDTLDVARYVDRVFAGGRLFPAAKEGLQHVIVGHIENDVEAVTFKLADPQRIAHIEDVVERTENIRHKERRFGRGCVDAWQREASALRRQAEALLEPFDLMVKDSPFLLGNEPVYADFALLGIAGNITHGGYAALPRRLAALARWRARLEKWVY
ncbi:MAG: glutathione S-transferase family protein [Opitutaceae bacterium]